MALCEKIKEARKKAGLTQQQLGEKLGVSASMLGQYETGKRTPKLETMVKIAKALGDESLLFTGDYPFIEVEKEDVLASAEIIRAISDGISTIIEALYGAVEIKKVEANNEQDYYRVIHAKGGSFIIESKTYELLYDLIKRTVITVINSQKDNRPEDVIVQEIKSELEKVPPQLGEGSVWIVSK